MVELYSVIRNKLHERRERQRDYLANEKLRTFTKGDFVWKFVSVLQPAREFLFAGAFRDT